jgi:ATP-dependent Clp protease ATP-binding subunit ClpX
LFIAGGAFDGIERIISKRLNRQAVGYSTQKMDNIDKEFITILSKTSKILVDS